MRDGAGQFDALLSTLIERYIEEGDVYYHELIGILQMHIAHLTLDAYGIFDVEEDDEEEDESWGTGNSIM